MSAAPHFVTLGMFIIDEISYLDEDGRPSGKTLDPQIGGGGTYAAVGARMWLSADRVGMVIDRGSDFPPSFQTKLESFGSEMWLVRDSSTTRALNTYRGQHRSFKYLTPRIRITPNDLKDTRFARSQTLHFICSPARASAIMSEVHQIDCWFPTTIYEPIPVGTIHSVLRNVLIANIKDRCIPEELPALIKVLPSISILSPNAEEALSLLSQPLPPTKVAIEQAAAKFMAFGVGGEGNGCVIIRCGEMGAYVLTRERKGEWINAFWSGEDCHKVVEVTGAGNGFLGGLAAGLLHAHGDVYEAVLYATVSASFTIEQHGLPSCSLQEREGGMLEKWNGDLPAQRLEELRIRLRR